MSKKNGFSLHVLFWYAAKILSVKENFCQRKKQQTNKSLTTLQVEMSQIRKNCCFLDNLWQKNSNFFLTSSLKSQIFLRTLQLKCNWSFRETIHGLEALVEDIKKWRKSKLVGEVNISFSYWNRIYNLFDVTF